MSTSIYEQIGKIAMNTSRPLTITQLAEQLGIQKNGRNIHNHIRGAYNYFSKKDAIVAGKISGAFVGENGVYTYM